MDACHSGVELRGRDIRRLIKVTTQSPIRCCPLVVMGVGIGVVVTILREAFFAAIVGATFTMIIIYCLNSITWCFAIESA